MKLHQNRRSEGPMRPSSKRSLYFWTICFLCVLFLAASALVRGDVTSVSRAAENSPPSARAQFKLPALRGNASLLFSASYRAGILHQAEVNPAAAERKTPVDLRRLLGADSSIVKMLASPNQQRIAVVMEIGHYPVSWVLELKNPAQPVLTQLVPEGLGEVLAWHPNNRHVLYKALDLNVVDSGLWIVDTLDGSHTLVTIPDLAAPQGILTASFSSDGAAIVYAESKGLGFGSTVWRTTDFGATRAQLLRDERGVVSNLVWSPDGQEIAFTTLPDSPTPFTAAGLFVMRPDGSERRQLGVADGGHGQSPVWSQDGQRIFFVARDNLEDRLADYDPTALVSSVRAVEVKTRKQTVVVPAAGKQHLDLALAPTGELFFASSRSGTLETWKVDQAGALQQVTNDGSAKRYPVVVQLP